MTKFSVYLQCQNCHWSEPGEVGDALGREVGYEDGKLIHKQCGGEIRAWGFAPAGEHLDLKFTRHHRAGQTVVIVHLALKPKMANAEPMSQYKVVDTFAATHREST